MLTFDIVFLLLLIAVIGFIWYESLRARELVISHCQRLCRETELQLLDQTVSLTSLSMKRATDGRLRLLRTYQFEVSDNGVDRYPGYVTSHGPRIIESRLEGPQGRSTYYQPRTPSLH